MKKLILFTLALLTAGFVGGVTNYSHRTNPEIKLSNQPNFDVEGFISSLYGIYPGFDSAGSLLTRFDLIEVTDENYVEAEGVFSTGTGDVLFFYDNGISGLLPSKNGSASVALSEYAAFTSLPDATFSSVERVSTTSGKSQSISWSSTNNATNSFFLMYPPSADPVLDDTAQNPNPAAVPEPGSLLLFILGVAGITFLRRRNTI